MCGRGVMIRNAEDLRRITGAQAYHQQQYHKPNYNVAPQQSHPVLIRDQQQQCRVLTRMIWGLVPSYTKSNDKGFPQRSSYLMINARGETVASNSVFRRLVNTRRCVMVLDAFFEWKDKHPFMVKPKQDGIMYLAGLYDVWRSEKEGIDDIETFAVLTTDAAKDIDWLHDRMPVILTSSEDVDRWLNAEEYKWEDCCHLVHPQNDYLITIEVSTFVNSVKNNSPNCILPKEEYEKKKRAQGISRFFTSPKNSTEEKPKSEAENDLPAVPSLEKLKTETKPMKIEESSVKLESTNTHPKPESPLSPRKRRKTSPTRESKPRTGGLYAFFKPKQHEE